MVATRTSEIPFTDVDLLKSVSALVDHHVQRIFPFRTTPYSVGLVFACFGTLVACSRGRNMESSYLLLPSFYHILSLHTTFPPYPP